MEQVNPAPLTDTMHDSFCYHPFHGLDIDNDGSLLPCCKFKPKQYPGWQSHNVTSDLDAYLASSQLKNLQEDFMQGRKPQACERCWRDEAAGTKSKRQLDAARYSSNIHEQGIRFLSVPMGNLCNLKCRICDPAASSSWIKEHRDLFGSNVQLHQWHKDAATWRKLIDIAQDCLELHIHGGEPFLHDHAEHLEIINSISASGKSANMRLHYSTNGTVWPNDDLWRLWHSFKSIDIQISVDDVGQRFEYNRHPAKWPEVQQNLMRYVKAAQHQHNLQLSISTTVSAFTIYYLDDMFDQLMSMGLPRPWLGRLHTPEYFRAGIFKPTTKQDIAKKLMRSPHLNIRATSAWLMEDDSLYYERFLHMIQLQDQYRREDFAKTFPELLALMSKN